MGISGLLPALKSIQVTKSLSDFKGKNIAVDAYVWLHKGAYSCATELATGKNTSKYVDYSMHRVRLLKHFSIEPYIVFDGGPLPAKKGTEDDRQKKREECLARGNALAAQGKHSQARECYVKCVDVTPQMAYQLIKALKAEGVKYVVAPYEADAQLAYLERVGLVDAILTEDSDLLVFGCKNVLFKLDTTANTVSCISRSDFASVYDSNVNSISLLGWSDNQFRAMAILSGCDYLPSIPGIGLKRACSLLRKWKTVEQVVRSIMLEGKLKVPNGYLEKFVLAEKCFLHQRIYSPLEERLVHLTEVDGEWDQESDEYVGGELDPKLARAIAIGDVDPVTLLSMTDINPGFKPRALKPIPSLTNASPRKDKGKGKTVEKPKAGGILNFFGPNPTIPPRSKSNCTPNITIKTPVAGKASGKRTLVDVMDHEISEKRRRLKHHESAPLPLAESKFFSGPIPQSNSAANCRWKSLGSSTVAGLSQLQGEENVIMISSDCEEEDLGTPSKVPDGSLELELDASNLSMVVQRPSVESDFEIEEPPEPVEQEDGYLSPTSSYCLDTQDLSSPPRPEFTPRRDRLKRKVFAEDDNFEADILSSPISPVKLEPSWRARRSRSATPTKHSGFVTVQEFADDTAKPIPGLFNTVSKGLVQSSVHAGPDLLDLDGGSEVEWSEDEKVRGLVATVSVRQLKRSQSDSVSGSTAPPTPSPETPLDTAGNVVPLVIDVDELSDYEDQATRTQAFMNGWREKWSLNGSEGKKIATPKLGKTPGGLKRNETNITPLGKHFLARNVVTLRSAPAKSVHRQDFKPKRLPKSRKNLVLFSETVKTRNTKTSESSSISDVEDFVESSTPINTIEVDEDSEGQIISRAQERLMRFRCGP